MNLGRNLIVGFLGLALAAIPMTVSAQTNDNGQNRNQTQSHERAQASTSEQARPESRSNSAMQEKAGHEKAAPEANRSSEQRKMSNNESREQKNMSNESREQKNMTSNQPREHENRTAEAAPEANHPEANHEEHHDNGNWHGDRNYVEHDHGGGTYAAGGGGPIWVMPEGYAGGPCAWAHHLRVVIDQDRESGHPAAADDLMPHLYEAERRCHG